MNPNLPMSFEAPAAPYIRPHTKEKKTRKRRLSALVLVVLIMVGMGLAIRFLPDGLKESFGFLSGTTAETTTDGATSTQSTTSESTSPPETENIYRWECSLPQGATAILPCDHSANAMGIFMENPTELRTEAITPRFPQKSKGEISVIIMNTHSFEAYANEGAMYYLSADFASNGIAENRVSAVADALCDALMEQGIGAMFVDCMTSSSIGSYRNAKKLAELALEDHPEAVLVIDIHRAILTDDTGALLRPITKIAEKIAAQARILLGTGANAEENAAVALSFYETVNMRYEDLMMPLSVSENALLQALPVPVLTLEIGSAGNSVAEARQTVMALAQVIADMMTLA